MSPSFLFTGPDDAAVTLLLAHGSGAPMDSPSMNAAAAALSAEGLRVARFEFPYMAARRTEGSRRPPPKAETLNPEFRAAVAALQAKGPLVIGGKSMGGRVASLLADRAHAEGLVAALVCLGYPFHPTGKPEQLRTEHLARLACPALIVQGERDPFGNRDEVAGYTLSPAIALHWAADGDHDLGPRGASGFTRRGNLTAAADAIAAFAASVGPVG